ncbi:MAG TPA: hypothetical protein ENH94_08490, partial [Phycisphaerales bacterium]|nr:hypothetical protein [Phycisphaerales bacterium]
MKKLDLKKMQTLIDLAVEEDFGQGDPTSELTIPEDVIAKASLVSREEIVVAGMEVAAEVLKRYDRRLKIKILKRDGSRANVADKLATITGPLRSMLSAERVVLNFLQRLSGIATTTHKYVVATRGTKAKIYDTRKTIPGWRELEKYAVSDRSDGYAVNAALGNLPYGIERDPSACFEQGPFAAHFITHFDGVFQ